MQALLSVACSNFADVGAQNASGKADTASLLPKGCIFGIDDSFPATRLPCSA